MRRIIMPVGLAAGVLIAAGVLLIGLPPRTASAADRLKEVVDANSTYRGWIHIVYERLAGATDQPDPQPRMETYQNTADGTFICVSRQRGRLEVDCVRPADRTCGHYASNTNELRVSPLIGDAGESVRRQALANSSVTVEEMLQRLRTRLGQNAVDVRSGSEGGDDRFDVTWTETPGSAPGAKTNHVTLWADPRSHLIVRSEMTQQGQAYRVTSTYGTPVADVYAVGVPRDAKVIDTSNQPQLREVLDRLNNRIASSLGDYVAVVTETIPQGPAVPRTQPDTINLYAQAGSAWLWCQYPIAGTEPVQGSGTAVNRPEGWPSPDVAGVAAQLRGVRPARYLVCDGRQSWNEFGSDPLRDESHMMASRAAFSLAGLIWPNGMRFASLTPDTQLLKDEQHPGLVGLKITPALRDFRHGDVRSEQVYWFDPARNDVLVEKTEKNTGPDGNWLEMRTRCSAYAQLPGGLWYPVQWSTGEFFGPSTDNAYPTRTHRYQLQMVPGMKLDPEWFTPPARESSPVSRQPSVRAPAAEAQPQATSSPLAEFDQVYVLAEGQVLKRIAPPFVPDRLEYFRRTNPSQAKTIPDGPQVMRLGWSDQLHPLSMGYGNGLSQLGETLRGLGLQRYEYDGPKELLDLAVPGDWIIRDGSTIQDRLAALEGILRDELKQPVRFERRIVERDTIVIRGDWQFHPSPDVQPGDSKYVNLYADEADATDATKGSSGFGTSALPELFAIVGSYLNLPVADERSSPDTRQAVWRVHRSALLLDMPDGPARLAKADLILKHLAEQTSLQFTREPRKVAVWFVSRADPSERGAVAGQ